MELPSIAAALSAYERLNQLFAQAGKDIFSAENQRSSLARFHELLLNSGRNALERNHLPGHITGSALVVSPDFKSVLLTHHAKLDLWLQLGGHADGQDQAHEVALREAMEESGLNNFSFSDFKEFIGHIDGLPAIPFDVDIHVIPGRPDMPTHEHYDVRYLLVADPNETVKISEESHDVRWFSLAEARKITAEESMHRQFAKAEWLTGHN